MMIKATFVTFVSLGFNRRDHLNDHIKTHDEEREKKHKYRFCVYSTDKKYNLDCHVQKQHAGEGTSQMN